MRKSSTAQQVSLLPYYGAKESENVHRNRLKLDVYWLSVQHYNSCCECVFEDSVYS